MLSNSLVKNSFSHILVISVACVDVYLKPSSSDSSGTAANDSNSGTSTVHHEEAEEARREKIASFENKILLMVQIVGISGLTLSVALPPFKTTHEFVLRRLNHDMAKFFIGPFLFGLMAQLTWKENLAFAMMSMASLPAVIKPASRTIMDMVRTELERRPAFIGMFTLIASAFVWKFQHICCLERHASSSRNTNEAAAHNRCMSKELYARLLWFGSVARASNDHYVCCIHSSSASYIRRCSTKYGGHDDNDDIDDQC